MRLHIFTVLLAILLISIVHANTKEYNFNSTYEGINAFLRAGDNCDRTTLNLSNLYDPITDFLGGDCFSNATANDNIDSSDNAYVITTHGTTTSNQGSYLIGIFKIDESVSEITEIIFKFEGKVSSNSLNDNFYVWNVSSGSYYLYDSDPLTESEATITFNSTEEGLSASDLINSSGYMHIGFVDSTIFGSDATTSSDAMNITIEYTPAESSAYSANLSEEITFGENYGEIGGFKRIFEQSVITQLNTNRLYESNRGNSELISYNELIKSQTNAERESNFIISYFDTLKQTYGGTRGINQEINYVDELQNRLSIIRIIIQQTTITIVQNSLFAGYRDVIQIIAIGENTGENAGIIRVISDSFTYVDGISAIHGIFRTIDESISITLITGEKASFSRVFNELLTFILRIVGLDDITTTSTGGIGGSSPLNEPSETPIVNPTIERDFGILNFLLKPSIKFIGVYILLALVVIIGISIFVFVYKLERDKKITKKFEIAIP